MTKYCNFCGTEFEPDNSQQRLCSDGCRKDSRRESKQRSNVRVGKVLVGRDGRGKSTYPETKPGGSEYDRWLRREIF